MKITIPKVFDSSTSSFTATQDVDTANIYSVSPPQLYQGREYIQIELTGGKGVISTAITLEEYQKLLKGGSNMLDSLKKYLGENRDFIFTLALLFVADQFLLNGALRAKLENLCNRTADRLTESTNAKS